MKMEWSTKSVELHVQRSAGRSRKMRGAPTPVLKVATAGTERSSTREGVLRGSSAPAKWEVLSFPMGNHCRIRAWNGEFCNVFC